MIRVATLLGCVLLAAAGTILDDNCTSGIFFNRQYYDKEVLKADILNADELSYLNDTNTLFFSYRLPENSTGYFTTAYLNLDTKEFSAIPGMRDGTTTAVDSESGDVYFGGENGIYKFNPVNKSAEFFTAEAVNIWAVFYDEQLFYVAYPQMKLYNSDGEQAYESNITVSRLIGNSQEYFLYNSSGIFRVVNDNEEGAELFGEPEQFYRGFAQDSNKNVYVFDTEAVYVPNRERKSLDKVADIDHLYGIAFDRDNNIIISDFDTIFRLTPSQANCPRAA